MALKDKLRLGARKRSSSSGEHDATGGTVSGGTVTPECECGGDGGSSHKTHSSRFMRALRSKLSKKRATPAEPPAAVDDDIPPHLNRPFTTENLEHQRLLRKFSWSTGRRKTSHRSSISTNISPCTSPRASRDYGYHLRASYAGDSAAAGRDAQPRFGSGVAKEMPPTEVPGQESDPGPRSASARVDMMPQVLQSIAVR